MTLLLKSSGPTAAPVVMFSPKKPDRLMTWRSQPSWVSGPVCSRWPYQVAVPASRIWSQAMSLASASAQRFQKVICGGASSGVRLTVPRSSR